MAGAWGRRGGAAGGGGGWAARGRSRAGPATTGASERFRGAGGAWSRVRRPGKKGAGGDVGAGLGWEEQRGQGRRPKKGRTWGRRGETPVVKVTGGHDTGVSLAALIAVRPGCRPRLIYRTPRARRGDKRKGFTETDYARLLDAAHHQLGGPVVLVWDGLHTHTSRAMRELIVARRS